MDLILWRHADAEDGSDDLARRLTDKGERQAAKMAVWLKRMLPDGYQVICSEAVRARQTAAHLKQKAKLDARLNPGAAVQAYLEVAEVRGPEERCVVLVGHQPCIGATVAQLLQGEAVAGWSVRKGSICWLQVRERDGVQQVVVKTVLAPEQIG